MWMLEGRRHLRREKSGSDQKPRRVEIRSKDKIKDNDPDATLMLKYDDMRYSEIAESMGISGSAVKSLLHRARETLKEKLGHYDKN
jgi:DNA-directed RNA polymerase specialized sigma24 family protein